MVLDKKLCLLMFVFMENKRIKDLIVVMFSINDHDEYVVINSLFLFQLSFLFLWFMSSIRKAFVSECFCMLCSTWHFLFLLFQNLIRYAFI